jgi:putative ABC transport system ATP-binding protein
MGQTIMIITHDADVARKCDRIIRLHDGRVVADEVLCSKSLQGSAQR